MSDRIVGPSGGKRRRLFLALFSLAALGALIFAIASFASPGPVGQAQGFEDDDGNLAPGDVIVTGQPSPNFDWNSFADVTWSPHPATTPTRQTDAKTVNGFQFKGIEDYPNPGASSGTTADTSFNGGVKQDNNCAGVGTGKPPNKDDLKRVYLASKTGSNGHTYLDLAWARIPQNSTSASAHVGFEFNQGTTACGAGSDGLVQRTAGDLLIVYDFEGGSAAPVLTLRKWVTSPSATCEVGSNTPPCWGTAQNLTTGGFAEGKVNTANVTDELAPPALSSTSGTSVDETLATQEFGEAGIDLTAAGVIPANACASFGKAYAVSRSSGNSAQAQMKDLVGPANFSLTNCGTIKIIKHTDPRGLDQNFGFTSNIAGSQLSCTADTTPASFTLNDSAGVDNSTNTETCTNVPAGNYTVTEGADPTGFTFESLTCTATGAGSSGSQDATDPKQANITIAGGGVVTCTYVNQQQLGAIEILKTGKDKSQGSGDQPLAGAQFSIKDPDGNALSGSPFTTDANGRICVDGLSFGDYTVQETQPPDGYSADDTTEHTVTVDNNAKCDDDPYVGESEPFTDTPLTDLTVTSQAQSDGANGSGATESSIRCTTGDPTGFPGTDVGNSPDPASGTANPAEVDANGLEPGTYTCKVVIDP
jgi:hypothetical protein